MVMNAADIAVQGPAPPPESPRPDVLHDLARIRYSIALSSPADGKLRHIPYTALNFEQQEGDVATRVTASIPDVDSDLGPLWELCALGTPLWLLAGTESMVEMFRGTIMVTGERTSNGPAFGIVAYDGLHVGLLSKYDVQFATGPTFTEFIQRYAAVANVPLGQVEEPGVTLTAGTYRQKTMIDALTDALKEVAAKGGGSLKLRAREGKLEAVRPAANGTIYHFQTAGAAIQTTIKGDISDMVGRVIVLGHGSDAEQLPVLNTLESNLGFTGAQEMVLTEESDSDEVVRLSAEAIMAEKGFPKWTYSHTGFLVPAIYKWERVRISDGIVDNHFVVTGISMDIVGRTMDLKLTTTEDLARATKQIEIQTALDALKPKATATTGKTGTGTSGGGGADRLLSIMKPVTGLSYVWGGAGGRSDFSANLNGVGTDCSGFVNWMTHQLGSSTGTYTDAIASQSTLVGTNTVEGAAPGDYVLYWDGGETQAGMQYPHVAMYLGPGDKIIESGGSVKPSGIGVGHILTGYPKYEIRRNPAVYNALNAAASTTAGPTPAEALAALAAV